MRKTLLILLTFVSCSIAAQKTAYVDMAYILKNLAQYESANDQLNMMSRRWQKEVEALNQYFIELAIENSIKLLF